MPGFSMSDFGLEGRVEQIGRCRQVLDDGLVRALAGAVDRVDRHDLQAELRGRLGHRLAAGARVLILVVHVEQLLAGLGDGQFLADARLRPARAA